MLRLGLINGIWKSAANFNWNNVKIITEFLRYLFLFACKPNYIFIKCLIPLVHFDVEKFLRWK